MKLQRLATLATAIGATLLTACGGGGTSATLGGPGAIPGGSGNTPASFTSWSAVQDGSTTTLNGVSQSGTYTYNTTTDLVTSRSIGASSIGASVGFTLNSTGDLTTLSINPVGVAPITFSSSTDTFGVLNINNDIGAVVSADGTKYALIVDEFAAGWNFQSFGIWTTGAGTGSGGFGAVSVGAETAGSAIPTSGVATYVGYAGGRYINPTGSTFFTNSLMTATADFAARNISFATTSTTMTPDLVTSSTNSSLNMTGTLTYQPATNQITGAASTAGGLTGNVNGRFYGPTAQEIGGTFSATNSGNALEGYAGAFGGIR